MLSFIHQVRSQWLAETLAEFLGTFMLIFMGNNAVAQKVLSDGKAGSFSTVIVGYGLGAFLGVTVAAGISGAHLNPAVTVAGAVVKKFEWSKVPHYLLGQYLGGFCAACCTYLLYLDGFNDFHADGGADLTTAGIFATYPRDGLTVMGGFVDQVLGTAVLLFAIYAIVDKRNTALPLYLVPFSVSFLIIAIGASIGFNEGFAINPARDFAPRLFTFLSCWGDQVFGKDTFWYIPIIAPHIGAVLGAKLYVMLVEDMSEVPPSDVASQVGGKKMSIDSLSTMPEAYKKSSSISSQGAFTIRM